MSWGPLGWSLLVCWAACSQLGGWLTSSISWTDVAEKKRQCQGKELFYIRILVCVPRFGYGFCCRGVSWYPSCAGVSLTLWGLALPCSHLPAQVTPLSDQRWWCFDLTVIQPRVVNWQEPWSHPSPCWKGFMLVLLPEFTHFLVRWTGTTPCEALSVGWNQLKVLALAVIQPSLQSEIKAKL